MWWKFLLIAILVWGADTADPVILEWNAGCQAFGRLDFQSRAHRALWRKITGTDRMETDAPALDGAHMLDVGGSGLIESSLRHFLLRRVRANQAAEVFFDKP